MAMINTAINGLTRLDGTRHHLPRPAEEDVGCPQHDEPLDAQACAIPGAPEDVAVDEPAADLWQRGPMAMHV